MRHSLAHGVGRACLIALFATAWPWPASAQGPHPAEIFGGYAFAHDALNNVSLPAGWLAGGAFGVNGWLWAVVDVSGGYKTIDAFGSDIRLSAHAVMFGVRASARIGRLTEFGELLAGVVRGSGAAFGFTDTTNAIALQPGVGVDFPVGPRVAARAELGARLIRSKPGGNEAGYEYRFSAALVYRLR
jgi:hypothetical protein